MDDYSKLTMEELLEKRLEIGKKQRMARNVSSSPMVHQQIQFVLDEIEHQIRLKQAQSTKDDDSDDPFDDVLNIG